MHIIKSLIKKNPKLLKFIRKIINTTKKILFKYCRYLIKVDEKMVIFDAFLGKSYSCNPKAIYEEMLTREEFNDWTFVWSVRKSTKIDLNRGKTVRYNSFRYFYYLAKSKYWVFNSKMPIYVHKKDNQIYLQTWHGTPLKKLARDINIGKEATFYRSKMSKDEMVKTYDVDAKRYNYLISPNKYSTEKFISAFGVEKDIIIESGYPRNDILSNYTENQLNSIKRQLGIDNSKKIILYAPTWRDNTFDAKGYSFTPKVDFKKWKNELGDEYFIIYKPHYLITNNIKDESLNDFVYYSKSNDNINDLYLISDILITDYSSVFFDYGILKRPMLFYMFDLEDYKNDIRGFYFDVNKLPGPIIEDEDKLIESIKDIQYIINKYKARYDDFYSKICYLEDGKASKRIVDKVFTS